VLADIAAQGGVDGYWLLGDLAAIGYDPAAAVARCAGLPNVRATRGNTDRLVTAFDMDRAAAEAGDAGVAVAIEVARGFAWTQGALAPAAASASTCCKAASASWPSRASAGWTSRTRPPAAGAGRPAWCR
jgi:hypothetical protein